MTSTIKLLTLVIGLFITSTTFAQVGWEFGSLTDLGSAMRTNTSFVNNTLLGSVFNESTDHFASSINFNYNGSTLTFNRITVNPNNFTVEFGAPLTITPIGVSLNCGENGYGYGYTNNSGLKTIWSDVGTSILSPARSVYLNYSGQGDDNVAQFVLLDQGGRKNQNNESYFTLYEATQSSLSAAGLLGKNVYLSFVETDPMSCNLTNWNDGVFLIENGTVIPEPSTYALVLGVGTMGLVLFRRWRQNTVST